MPGQQEISCFMKIKGMKNIKFPYWPVLKSELTLSIELVLLNEVLTFKH